MKINTVSQRGGFEEEIIFCLYFTKFNLFNKLIPYILTLGKTWELFFKKTIHMPLIMRVFIPPHVHHY